MMLYDGPATISLNTLVAAGIGFVGGIIFFGGILTLIVLCRKSENL